MKRGAKLVTVLDSHRQTKGKCDPHKLSLIPWKMGIESNNQTNGDYKVQTKFCPAIFWHNPKNITKRNPLNESKDDFEIFIQLDREKATIQKWGVQWLAVQLNYLCIVIWSSLMIICLITRIIENL